MAVIKSNSSTNLGIKSKRYSNDVSAPVLQLLHLLWHWLDNLNKWRPRGKNAKIENKLEWCRDRCTTTINVHRSADLNSLCLWLFFRGGFQSSENGVGRHEKTTASFGVQPIWKLQFRPLNFCSLAPPVSGFRRAAHTPHMARPPLIKSAIFCLK